MKKTSNYYQPKGFYNPGYKSSWKPISNSSFWLGQDDIKDAAPGKDLLKLAGYKRAISNFVRIVTGKDNIPVNFSSGQQSYTDGQSVVLSAKMDENEFDPVVGLALHEGSHIALTDFKYTMNALDQYKSVRINGIVTRHNLDKSYGNLYYLVASRLKDIVNVIEDRRIDKYIYDSAPGYRGYYLSMYDKYFNSKEIDKALKQGTKNEQTWDDYMFHIINFANPNRNLSTLPGLKEIWQVMDIHNISRLKSTREVFDVAEEVYDLITKYTASTDLAQSAQNKPQDQPQNKQQGQGQGNDAQDNSDKKENQPEGSSQEMGGGNESDGDDDLDIPQSGAASGSGSSTQQDAKSSRATDALEKAIKKQRDFLDGNIKKGKMSKADAERINALQDANITLKEVGDNYTQDYYYGKKMDGKASCVVAYGFTDAIEATGMLSNHIGSKEGYKRNIKNGCQKDYIADAIALGTMLGKRLKTRDENRSLKTTRMETGRIDRRLIAELGFDNARIFSQTIHTTTTPALIHISVDASGSMGGSKWQSAIKTAVAIAKAATMVQSLDCVISLRGTSSGNVPRPLMWVVYDSRKDSFNVIKNKFCTLRASGSTPEGLCYEAVLSEIIKSAQGKDAYFINLCDGEPGFSGEIYYSGPQALAHTRTQVEKMRKAGIAVLGYFISDGYSNPNSERAFREMYGNDSEFIDVSSLAALAKSLNSKFVKGV